MRGSFNLCESAGVRLFLPLPSGQVSFRKSTEREPFADADRSDKLIWRNVFFVWFSIPRVEGELRSPFIKARGAYRIFLTAMKALSPDRAEVLRFRFN